MRSVSVLLIIFSVSLASCCSITKYEQVIRERDKAQADLKEQKQETQAVLEEAQRLANGNNELARQNARIRRGCDI